MLCDFQPLLRCGGGGEGDGKDSIKTDEHHDPKKANPNPQPTKKLSLERKQQKRIHEQNIVLTRAFRGSRPGPWVGVEVRPDFFLRLLISGSTIYSLPKNLFFEIKKMT